MSRTGTFFQMARGRAMVRTRAMREARAAKRAIEFLLDGNDSPARRILGGAIIATSYRTDNLVDLLRSRIGWQAKRARQANRDWREYRRLSADLD